jgi:Uma2 family endonuclease
MSTATVIPSTIRPAESEWIPSPLYRMTVEQYEAMVASGVFSKKDRLHLISGYLVAKMTLNPPHMTASELVGAELARIFRGEPYHIRAAGPVRLPNRDSEPEPDRCVVRGTIRDYESRHPGPADVALVVEVADSSLADDRELAREVYGPAGIPVYWIVNLVHRQVEVYTDPGPEGYRSTEVFREGQAVPVVIDGQRLGQVAIADLLPSLPGGPKAEGDGA